MRFSWKTITTAALLLAVAVVFIIILWPREKPVVEEPVLETPEILTTHERIGSSVEGRAIESYTFGNGDTHLLFVGGIHGGYEWNSVVLAYQFIDYFTEDISRVPDGVTIAIIPNANPDGVFKVIGKEGKFSAAEAQSVIKGSDTSAGRFNANEVDLNRNFDCKWKPESSWRSRPVKTGTGPFSEPEAQTIRDYVAAFKPRAAVFWHSQANAVYASECELGVLPETLDITNAYAQAGKYAAIAVFDAYPVSGDAEGWLASIGIPAITVELQTHESVEWERNLAGVKALLEYYTRTSL